jgi:hypothetical protein
MSIFNWFKKKTNPQNMKENLFEQAAYHESGHIIMAYLTKFKCDEVCLIESEPGNAYTKFDYGDIRMTFLIATMQNYISDPDIYHDLEANVIAATEKVAFKISGVLLVGPASEAIYKSGIEFIGNLEVDTGGPDLISRENFILRC